MKARIAVLDDERRMVDVLAMMLGREGYEVRPFVAAPALLQALEACPPPPHCVPSMTRHTIEHNASRVVTRVPGRITSV